MARGEVDFLMAPNVSLAVLCQRYPEIWQQTEPGVCETLVTCDPRAIVKHAAQAKRSQNQWLSQQARRQGLAQLEVLIAARMTDLAFKQYFVALRAKNRRKQTLGKWDFARPFMARYFDERRGHGRLPSMATLGKIWRLVQGKSQLLCRAYENGVYCVFTRELVAALAEEIGERDCLEIAAGDGVLAKHLSKKVALVATDNYSWQHSIRFGANVHSLAATEALSHYQPRVVLSCWPPALNTFEEAVFRCPSVETYIVLGSRYAFATGNFNAYQAAVGKGFSWTCSLALTALLFPEEIAGAAYVFQRLNRG